MVLQLLWSCSYYGPAVTMVLQLLWSCSYYGPAVTMVLQLLWSCSYCGPAVTMVLQLLWSCSYLHLYTSSTSGLHIYEHMFMYVTNSCTMGCFLTDNIDTTSLTEVEVEQLEKKWKDKTVSQLNKSVYHWKTIQ